MAGSIKLFLKLRQLYEAIGIYPSQINQRFCLNFKNLLFLFCLTQTLLPIIVYSCVQANSIEEYSMDFYAGISLLIAIINMSQQIWKGPQIFQLIEHLEEFIEKSKFHKIIELANKLNFFCGLLDI